MFNLRLNVKYYYICGREGMKSSGQFTKNRNLWKVFSLSDKNRIGRNKPLEAEKKGIFLDVKKFY